MNKTITFGLLAAATLALSGCYEETQESRDKAVVQQQQSQYAIAQPIPVYDWSLERHLLVQLYNLRNQEVATHSVWRSLTGKILHDCTSMGYGLPYDTSLTNPSQVARYSTQASAGVSSIGQAEPNGIFASTNTSATWVMCVGDAGLIEPIYIEATVNVYPFPLSVDYETDRVEKAGESSVTVSTDR